jgi:nitrogen regulatory protein P-II 1
MRHSDGSAVETHAKRSLPMMIERAAMTKVQAIVREQLLDVIIERLLLIGVRGLTLGQVKGSGDGASHREVFRGSSYRVDYVSKILIEWYGPDDEADAVIRAIQQRATTGAPGDGSIISQPVEEAIRIRTGERGLDAV